MREGDLAYERESEAHAGAITGELVADAPERLEDVARVGGRRANCSTVAV